MPINTCVVVYLRPHLFIRNHKMVWTQKLLRSFYSFLTTGNWELPSHGIKINCFSFLDLKSEWWVVSTGTKYQLQKVGIYHYFLDEYMLYLLATECRLPVYPTVLYLLLVQTIGWETTNKTNLDGGLRCLFCFPFTRRRPVEVYKVHVLVVQEKYRIDIIDATYRRLSLPSIETTEKY